MTQILLYTIKQIKQIFFDFYLSQTNINQKTKKMNQNDINLLIKAIDFAAVKHSTQRRKNEAKSPYIEHPIRVMKILSDSGITDLNTLIAGVLHDTVEDTETTPQEIAKEFNPKISQIVMEVTDDKSLPKTARKQGQIDHASSGEMLPESKNVKLADKYANLQDITTDPPTVWSKEEIQGYLNWSYCVCRPMFGSNPELDQKLQQLFESHQITEKDSSERLAKYYQFLEQKKLNDK